ncbi:acid resistance repetitive basic protein Asr [Serratia sp. UGAL515B_01]|nr:acid resistance repetitive basic protein Asr [Serratia sp. UGAL515B_01]WON78919.1 acid resistance repetitive basic protein Asr [Serratia sp. UGAL515B_01]
MKKVFALIVAAVMGLSSAAFAVQAVTPVVASNVSTQPVPAKNTHMKTHHMKKTTEQKAQAAKKHHKKSSNKAAAPTA